MYVGVCWVCLWEWVISGSAYATIWQDFPTVWWFLWTPTGDSYRSSLVSTRSQCGSLRLRNQGHQTVPTSETSLRPWADT